MKSAPTAFKKILLVSFVSIVALLAGEGLLRLLLKGSIVAPPIYKAIDSPPGYALAPDLKHLWLQYGRAVPLSTDVAGHRVVPNAPTDPNLPKIHLIGDSQVFGQGLADAETIAAQLQEKVGAGFRVINHGVPGYGPYAYQKALQSISIEDRVVVVQTETNDLWDSYTAVSTSNVRCGYLAPKTFFGQHLPCALLDMRAFQILSAIINGAVSNRKAVPHGFDAHAQVASKVLMFRNARLFESHKRTRGDKLIFTYIPWEAVIDKTRLNMYTPEASNPVRFVQFPDDCDVERAFLQASQPETLFLPYDDHISARGAELMASAIARRLQQNMTGH